MVKAASHDLAILSPVKPAFLQAGFSFYRGGHYLLAMDYARVVLRFHEGYGPAMYGSFINAA